MKHAETSWQDSRVAEGDLPCRWRTAGVRVSAATRAVAQTRDDTSGILSRLTVLEWRRDGGDSGSPDGFATSRLVSRKNTADDDA
ncbi:hypothetical protein MTO96_008911 [Rhipicephalus appendiculatus]